MRDSEIIIPLAYFHTYHKVFWLVKTFTFFFDSDSGGCLSIWSEEAPGRTIGKRDGMRRRGEPREMRKPVFIAEDGISPWRTADDFGRADSGKGTHSIFIS
jgi:hypothetical protein